MVHKKTTSPVLSTGKGSSPTAVWSLGFDDLTNASGKINMFQGVVSELWMAPVCTTARNHFIAGRFDTVLHDVAAQRPNATLTITHHASGKR